MRKLKKVQLPNTPREVHVNSLVVSQVGSMFVDGTVDQLNKFYQNLRSRNVHFVAKQKFYLSSRSLKSTYVSYTSSFASDYVHSYVHSYPTTPYVYFGPYLSRPRYNDLVVRQPDLQTEKRSRFRSSRVGLYVCRTEEFAKREFRLAWDELITYRRFPSEWHPEMEEALTKALLVRKT